MMEMIDDSHYELKSGRQFYAFRGVIGLAPDDDDVCYGWDGSVGMSEWTVEERRELADFMIARWTEWKAAIR